MAYRLIIKAPKIASFSFPSHGAVWVEEFDVSFDLPIHWTPEQCNKSISDLIKSFGVEPYRNLGAYEDNIDRVKDHLTLAANDILNFNKVYQSRSNFGENNLIVELYNID